MGFRAGWTRTSRTRRGVRLLAGLFGWEFKDVMPPGSNGKIFVGQYTHSEAAVGDCRSRRLRQLCDTYILVGSASEGPASKVHTASRRRRKEGAFRRVMKNTSSSAPSSPIPRERRSASGNEKEHKGARVVNEHGAFELQRTQHA